MPWVVKAANAVSRLAGLAMPFSAGDFDLDDGHIGSAYGVPSAASLAAVALGGRSEGLVLDPVYTGKALHGLAQWIRSDGAMVGKRVLFVHTGGLPGLLAQGEEFERCL